MPFRSVACSKYSILCTKGIDTYSLRCTHWDLISAGISGGRQLSYSEVNPMNYRQSPKMTMTGLKSHASQRGIGQWWMVLTIGIMVGFIFGFILFLSRLPDEQYTLVETERGVEQIEEVEASEQYTYLDRLSDTESAVPNAAANEMPAFTRENSAGKYGAGINERPSAVKIADELSVGVDVAPVEIAAVGGATAGAGNAVRRTVASNAGNQAADQVNSELSRQPTTVRRYVDRPSTSYYLQAGAFVKGTDAERLQRQLNQSGIDAFIKKVAIEGKQWHRVRIGPFYDSRSLDTAQSRLGRTGISYMVIKVQS